MPVTSLFDRARAYFYGPPIPEPEAFPRDPAYSDRRRAAQTAHHGTSEPEGISLDEKPPGAPVKEPLIPLQSHPACGAAMFAMLRGQPLDLDGYSFKGLHLIDVDLARQKITGEQISGAASVTRCNLRGVDMAGFEGAGELTETNLAECKNMTGKQLNGVTELNRCDLGSMDMTGFSGRNKVMAEMKFGGTQNFTGEALNGAALLRKVDLADVDMAGFSAEGMNLRTMNLAAAEGIKGHQLNGALEIKNSTFPKDGTGFAQDDTHLEGVDFRGSSTTGAQLNGHFGLIRASVGEMDMAGFHPRRVVEETDLSRCKNLSGQQLDRVSSLRGSNLGEIDMAGVDLKNTDCRETDFTRCANLTAAQFEGGTAGHARPMLLPESVAAEFQTLPVNSLPMYPTPEGEHFASGTAVEK